MRIARGQRALEPKCQGAPVPGCDSATVPRCDSAKVPRGQGGEVPSAKARPSPLGFSTVAPWHPGTVAPWHPGTVAPWHWGTLALWFCMAASSTVHAQQVPRPAADSTDLFTASPATQVIVFIGRDCPISNGYAPAIQRLCRDYAARGVRCTLVYEDREATPAAVREHLREYGYKDIETSVDGDGRIARRAGATVTPEAVVVDTQGTIRYRGRIDNRYAAVGRPRRHVTSHDLRDAVEAVLAKRPVQRPRTTALGCYITSERPGREKR